MTDIPEDAIVVRCTRVIDAPTPLAPSNMTACEVCHRSVWLSHQTVENVAGRHPDTEIHVTCVQCVPEGEHEIVHLPEQVHDLRAHGVPDMIIARTLACMEVAHGLTLEECAADIMADPTGVRAMAYSLALERTQAFVRGVGRER